MKTRIVFIALTVLCSLAQAYDKMEQTQVMNDIRGTLGMVPTFFKEYPPEGLPGAWMEFKNLQLSSNTALAPRTKDLIGLAVASQIPCRYCVYFHKKSASFNGASPSEIRMAIAIASGTRKWGTYFSGNQLDLPKFKTEIDKIVAFQKKEKPPMKEAPMKVTDATSAYKDMENNFGFVPDFIRSYPASGVAGAWRDYKEIQMNPQTILPPKVKDLVSLAVSSQMPCDYCTYADTEFAKLDGASTQEIQETVAVAGIVRHWSTFLNGLRQDDKTFEREVDQIFKHLERMRGLSPKKVSLQESEGEHVE